MREEEENTILKIERRREKRRWEKNFWNWKL